MSPEREGEIIADLASIIRNFAPSEEEPVLTMFGLIRRYNATGKNAELIGGEWAREHGIDLPDA